MNKVLIAGAGKIGSLIACMLSQSQDYEVHLVDICVTGTDARRVLKAIPNIQGITLDVTDIAVLTQYIKQHQLQAVISCMPYFHNVKLATLAQANQLHYFDLTEDVETTRAISQLAQASTSVFVPQCGLAPGFINIVANGLMQQFDRVESAKLRVGALPQNTQNALQYALTWSTDGLINEYGNPCYGIVDGHITKLSPLENIESVSLDGVAYEAFNTSGGLGGLIELYQGKIDSLTYKTLRYPGHANLIKFLMNDLKLNHDRATLKRILETAIPKTYQDVVLVYTSVVGYKDNDYLQQNYFKKIYPCQIAGITWSAIQVSTASGLCAVVDVVLQRANNYRGFLLQETISLQDFLNNRFGVYYQ